MNLDELMAALLSEHLIATGIWQDERIKALIAVYGDTCVLNAVAGAHQEQALIEASKPLEVPEGAAPDA